MTKLTGTDFRPAKPWGWLITLAGLLNILLLRRNTVLDIRPTDLTFLRDLPPGCLITPNHAHYSDPQVTFELARRAGRQLVYMTTREAFDRWGGWAGWFLQRLGAFSVNRGGTNEEARQFARAILVTGAYDLAMFPEGEIYLLNDVVMPLKPGVARLALEAASELTRQGGPARSSSRLSPSSIGLSATSAGRSRRRLPAWRRRFSGGRRRVPCTPASCASEPSFSPKPNRSTP